MKISPEEFMNSLMRSVAQSNKTMQFAEAGYEPLSGVLQLALNQAQYGKGKERHANSKPFLQQPIMKIGRMVGIGYNLGQAMKKSQEAMRLPTIEAQQAELLGAINYLASAYLILEEQNGNK